MFHLNLPIKIRVRLITIKSRIAPGSALIHVWKRKSFYAKHLFLDFMCQDSLQIIIAGGKISHVKRDNTMRVFMINVHKYFSFFLPFKRFIRDLTWIKYLSLCPCLQFYKQFIMLTILLSMFYFMICCLTRWFL